MDPFGHLDRLWRRGNVYERLDVVIPGMMDRQSRARAAFRRIDKRTVSLLLCAMARHGWGELDAALSHRVVCVETEREERKFVPLGFVPHRIAGMESGAAAAAMSLARSFDSVVVFHELMPRWLRRHPFGVFFGMLDDLAGDPFAEEADPARWPTMCMDVEWRSGAPWSVKPTYSVGAGLYAFPSKFVTGVVRMLATEAGRLAADDGVLDRTVFCALADALGEAGCEIDSLLSHLRSDTPHYRGCWALEVVRRASGLFDYHSVTSQLVDRC